ncbi:hypothetical protein P872_01355 [Rhodonellum psychrophilum GCM71 = DSM 17998]|uniref:Uncharacterized protein n=1 Tax=Rhodonellum psychrophilum GCM71 = DSM 17998 TaxID=1123057 RepID=U5BTJ9_9BACT|nr:hypothetical protein P872_01355 [Rhodonellum psychrophilum GCM71 = DSM 17998]
MSYHSKSSTKKESKTIVLDSFFVLDFGFLFLFIKKTQSYVSNKPKKGK